MLHFVNSKIMKISPIEKLESRKGTAPFPSIPL